MLLKAKYKSKFLAALLSMQNKEEKIDLYVSIARKNGINVLCPDVNLSEIDFKEIDGNILYGIRSIKGIGEASLQDIIDCRPYNSIQEAIDKGIPTGKFDAKGKEKLKKVMNKKVLFGFIKSGGFDFINSNRFALLNEAMDIRKDKEERYVPAFYKRLQCIELEQETLGTSVTNQLWFNTIEDGETFEDVEFEVISNSTKKDKRGNLMAFPKLKKDFQDIGSLVFSSVYKNNVRAFDNRVTRAVKVSGKRDKNKIIINKINSVIPFENNSELFNLGVF